MTISSIGSNAYFQYAGYQSTGLYGTNDSTFTLDQNQVQGAEKQQGGPPPPPPGGGRGGRMEGPDLDTDSDGYN